MMKKLFVFVLLLLSVLGCQNGVLKPDDFSRETIDKKYPYWQVGIESFEIDSCVDKYTTITVDEKNICWYVWLLLELQLILMSLLNV